MNNVNNVAHEVSKYVGDFTNGFVSQMFDEGTIGLACLVGLSQGLKYKGSLKNGIQAGAATIIAISVVNGVRCAIVNHNRGY